MSDVVKWNMKWTEEAVAKLRDLWPRMSREQVAQELGCTPSAASAKANKLKLDSGRKRGFAAGSRSPAEAPAPAPPPPRVPVGLHMVPPPKSCQWPFGEPGRAGFRFCGHETVPGRSYCQPHCEVAYVKPEAKPKAAVPETPKPSRLTVQWAA